MSKHSSLHLRDCKHVGISFHRMQIMHFDMGLYFSLAYIFHVYMNIKVLVFKKVHSLGNVELVFSR